MQPGISTHVFLPQRLHSGLLDALQAAGATVIEVFAARHHFDYTDRAAVRDLAHWFRDHNVAATLHQPIYITDRADTQWSRHVAPNLNLIDPEKSRRIAAQDEVKRALESAEQLPFTAITLHLGAKDEPWNLRALENSLTAIEHLKAFAHPLGVKVLLENIQNEVTTPEHLLEILRVGRFSTVGITLDLGHAHLAEAGIEATLELLRPRITQLNLHDNQGQRDQHLWPGEGTIDQPNVNRLLNTLPPNTPGILEIDHDLNETTDSLRSKASTFFSSYQRLTERLQSI